MLYIRSTRSKNMQLIVFNEDFSISESKLYLLTQLVFILIFFELCKSKLQIHNFRN